MENPNWLRLIVVGLVLAAMAFGYFLLSSKFTTKNKVQKTNVVETVQPSDTEIPAAPGSPSTTPQVVSSSTPSAYTRIAQRNQGIQTLPATGSPLFLISLLASSALVTGFSLRKFPH